MFEALANLLGKALANKLKKTAIAAGLGDKSSQKKMLIISIGPIALFLVIILVIVSVTLAPIMMAKQYVDDFKNDVAVFFEKVGNVLTLKGWCAESDGSCNKQAEQKYYEQLGKVYDKYSQNGIEIDVELISATIFYGNTMNNDNFTGEDVEEIDNVNNIDTAVDYSSIKLGDIGKLAKSMVSSNKINYDNYKSYLESTYIPNRFESMYPYPSDSEKSIKLISNDIMAFARSGNNSTTNLAYGNYYGSCKSVTLEDPYTGELSVHELEEYVAGVVNGELGGGAPEAQKLQAILARSFAVKNCNRVIINTEDDQVYKTPTTQTTEIAQATEGLILTYEGEILPEISFASYPKAFYRGFPGYEASGYLCGDVVCSTGTDGRNWCKTTMYKQPNMESYELYIPNNRLNGGTWNGSNLSNQTGHCYGISQVSLMYYEEELNYTYEQMISELLSPGVEIVSINSFTINGTASTEGTTFLPKPLSTFLQENGSSVEEFNGAIKQAVIEAGPGTRSGVIAAATSLINGLSSYDVKLPYLSSIQSGYPSGKYSKYGVDPEWGTNGKWYSSVYSRYYYQKGIDCSGFVSWAIHNGGFIYISKNSTGQSDLGQKYSFNKFTAQPADLVWQEGHIGLIIAVTESGYLIAEEAGGENGLIVNTIPFSGGRGFTRIIDMSSFYADSNNLKLDYYKNGGTL